MEKNSKENNVCEEIEKEFETNENCEVVDEQEENQVEETLEESEKNEDLEFEEMDEDDMGKKYAKLKEENDKNLEEINLLNNKLKAVQDTHIRTTAEYDNFRKRTVREKEQLYTDACSDVLKEIFPVVDNLERALDLTQEDSSLKQGVEMTLKQFNSSLEKLGIKEINTSEKFDPNFHEAVMHVVDENYGPSEIVEVFQKGYIRGEKVLRYSMVKVAN
ncbi:nucleotide exchange factor GrpE [Oceanirhabdus sp. W0125-5]|uniref:nucleotide exchange factor GrpE n=1 Tax=Oceanirhabdus sp. W0125-5 TaxID=2999116 RepID=UPI0022F32C8F|nr:nucleotide exchange factor GrpE [Oceanirhabdus sp. W0125-5]WBW95784.1 nucleotide exchange factor GrpE [Oceanirhabdus sp. W0125-5]